MLKGLPEKNNNKLDSDEFEIFLKGLQECILSNKWTNALENFYIKYFNVPKGFTIGSSNPCQFVDFEMKWGLVSLADILIQNEKYEIFKNSPDFPQIEAMGCCEFNGPVVKILPELSSEELAAKKAQLEKLDKKLYDIYEKSHPITGQETIQIDLDSLGLDLKEEALIDVPARDEKGKLIRMGEKLKWIERVVTLKTAAIDVIAELNRVIQSSIDKKVDDQSKGILLLNTNKEPLRTYNMLGVPFDKFYISQEEQKILWLQRILTALADAGCIKLGNINGHGYFFKYNNF